MQTPCLLWHQYHVLCHAKFIEAIHQRSILERPWESYLLDTIITEMEVRFNDFNRKAAKLLFLVPSTISNDDIDFDEEAFRETLEFYFTDIPDSLLLKQELEVWKRKWGMVKEDARPQNLSQSLKECDELTFPNLFVLLKIAATLPVTSCECERLFSVMRRLRTWLIACIGSARLRSGQCVSYDAHSLWSLS